MSDKKTYSDERGEYVWRTVGGRRIKIYAGQELDEAMRESGRFGNAIQEKIKSIHIEFDRDNILPGLNREDLDELGIEDRPILLKKSIIDKNLANHPDVLPKEYSEILGQSLYNHDLVAPGHENKPYYNFVARVGADKSTVVLLQVEETNTGYLEIVNLHWARNESRKLIEKKGKKIEKMKNK